MEIVSVFFLDVENIANVLVGNALKTVLTIKNGRNDIVTTRVYL